MANPQQVDFLKKEQPNGLLTQDLAREYLLRHEVRWEAMLRDRLIPFVLVPRIQPDSVRVHARLLDDVLYTVLTKQWSPLPRYGSRAVVSTREVATYLGLSATQVRGLVRAEHLPCTRAFHSGTTEAFRFQIGTIDAAITEWADAWETLPSLLVDERMSPNSHANE